MIRIPAHAEQTRAQAGKQVGALDQCETRVEHRPSRQERPHCVFDHPRFEQALRVPAVRLHEEGLPRLQTLPPRVTRSIREDLQQQGQVPARDALPDQVLERRQQEVEQLLTRPSLLTVHTLRLDPLWDPLRGNPRFEALLTQYASQ